MGTRSNYQEKCISPNTVRRDTFLPYWFSSMEEGTSGNSIYPDVKPGIAEEVAVMLDDTMEEKMGLISLERAAEFNNLAEKIFGYER